MTFTGRPLKQHHVWLAFTLLLSTTATGCFSRPVPSEAEYIQRYLARFDAEGISDLRFSYHGAVGGEASIAKFKIAETEIDALKSSGLELTQFDPKNADISALRRRIAMCSRWGTIPSWFDFPFNEQL